MDETRKIVPLHGEVILEVGGKPHPVFMPHWVDFCDTFTLKCVHCESVFISFCIC